MTAPSVLRILSSEHRIVVTCRAKDRVVGRARGMHVMYPLDREEGRWRYMGPACHYPVAAVWTDNNPEKVLRSLELHAIVYPSSRGFGKGYHRIGECRRTPDEPGQTIPNTTHRPVLLRHLHAETIHRAMGKSRLDLPPLDRGTLTHGGIRKRYRRCGVH